VVEGIYGAACNSSGEEMYRTFFRRLVNATALRSLVTYKENMGQKVYIRKFGSDFT